MKQKIGLVLGPLAFALIFMFFYPEGMTLESNAVLASTVWIAIWWITEAVPIPVTALLPIILFPLTGALEVAATTASYGHKFIFLFIGGFILAIAIEKCQLHKRIALNIINMVGTNANHIILGFMIATAFLSMWISNTATAVMILPVGVAIILQFKDNPSTKENENILFGKALMLSIAYSASIGGMATLIGTPPNLVLAGVISESYGNEITFSKWFTFGFPISIILLILSWLYLTKVAFKFPANKFEGSKEEIKKQLNELGKMSLEEKQVTIVFVLTAVCWITRSYILSAYVPAIDDTIIAISSSLILFLIPNNDKSNRFLHWGDAVKLPWGILILFGGGMALANGFEVSGLAKWLGTQMTSFDSLPLVLVLLILIASVNFLTEITSNLATTAMLLPVLVSLATAIDVHPNFLLVGATVAASCAFMLPVATPPNAVVFGSGYLKIEDMVKKGFWLNLVSILILTIMVYFFLPLIWDFF